PTGAVGVPVIVPFVEFSPKPAGNAGDILNVKWPPVIEVAVTGIKFVEVPAVNILLASCTVIIGPLTVARVNVNVLVGLPLLSVTDNW
ncbi:hypothetical protein OGY83_00020, partial [Citrobacter sp. Cpo090]